MFCRGDIKLPSQGAELCGKFCGVIEEFVDGKFTSVIEAACEGGGLYGRELVIDGCRGIFPSGIDEEDSSAGSERFAQGLPEWIKPLWRNMR